MESIIQTDKECFMCHTTQGLELHHCLYGSRHKLADKYGLTIWLCHQHHTGDKGVHFNKALDTQIKQIAQREFEDTYGHDEFMKIFGKNYL